MPDHMTTIRLAGVALAMVVAGAVDVVRAVDVPIAGKSVSISARSPRRTFAFRSEVDPAIAPPFVDPTLGAFLRVFVGSGPGQCHAEMALPAAFWSPLAGNGPQRGWRYRDQSASVQGIRTMTIGRRKAGGQIRIKGRGAFPCGLEAPQTGPLHVEFRVNARRYCATFGGSVRVNEAGGYRAAGAPAPAACLADGGVTVASLNVLHGLFCPPATNGCRRAERMALVRDFVVARGCPDVLAFQEVFNSSPTNENAQTLATLLTNACPAPYVSVYQGVNAVDDEMIFSRYPILDVETHHLLGPLRNVLRVRIDHPIGALDMYATHLASGGDLANSGCPGPFGPCPAECIAAGATTVRECQGIQMLGIIDATHDVPTPALALGDFNVEPGSFVYNAFVAHGLLDSYLLVGLPECDPMTGIGCTSGRIDDQLTDIEDPALNQIERIDFIWLIPRAPGSNCTGDVEPPGDPDGDGVATRPFADVPNPFSPSCGPSPDPVCWGSDHTGMQADVNCLF
jgi:endonuclease/exonuclease/phosphatase family metal-dependent hydrolase